MALVSVTTANTQLIHALLLKLIIKVLIPIML